MKRAPFFRSVTLILFACLMFFSMKAQRVYTDTLGIDQLNLYMNPSPLELQELF